MTFKATIKTRTLRDILTAISPITSEIKMIADGNGIRTIAVDPAHVAMVEVNIPSSGFHAYQATDEVLGLDVEKILGFIKLVATETTDLEYDANQGRLTMTAGPLTRKIATVDIESKDDPKIPNLDLKASARVPIAELSKITKATANIADCIKVRIAPERFQITAINDMDEVDMIIPKEQLSEPITADGEYASAFPLDYFTSFIRATPQGVEMKVSIANDYPATFEYGIGNNTIRYLLAPRIEGDE